jgi:hypothetical protein
MGWLKDLLIWNEDRYKIIQLRHELDRIDAMYAQARKAAGFQPGSQDDNNLYWSFTNDRELTLAELDEIETKTLLRRAKKWNIPIPARPIMPTEENEYWNWCGPHYRHYLSAMGKTYLRREAFAEMEMYSKPWATWLALGVSGLSLLISVLKS